MYGIHGLKAAFVLAVCLACLHSGRAGAQVNWGGSATTASLFFNGSAPSSPIATGTLLDTPDGFRYTNANFSYLSTTADVGHTLTFGITNQRLALGATDPTGRGLVTVSGHLDGTLTVDPGITFTASQPYNNPFELVTQYSGFPPYYSGRIAVVDTSGFVEDGVTANAFDVTSSTVDYPVNNHDYLMQGLILSFTPNAAGEKIVLNLPGSAAAQSPLASAAVPEPSLPLIFAAGLAGWFSLRRRKLMSG